MNLREMSQLQLIAEVQRLQLLVGALRQGKDREKEKWAKTWKEDLSRFGITPDLTEVREWPTNRSSWQVILPLGEAKRIARALADAGITCQLKKGNEEGTRGRLLWRK